MPIVRTMEATTPSEYRLGVTRNDAYVLQGLFAFQTLDTDDPNNFSKWGQGAEWKAIPTCLLPDDHEPIRLIEG